MTNINMLVDTDSIFFKIAYSATSESDMRKNYDTFCRKMELLVKDKLCNPFDEDEHFHAYYAVKGKDNFRKEFYPEYKATRPDLDQDIRDKLNFLFRYSIDKGARPADGMEADDLVSIWAHESRDHGEQYVICGIDKDLLQIPGNHYNYGKDTWQFVDDDTAHYNLMKQCLTGDNSDNIPGIKGIGPKKAEKILQGVPRVRQWNRVRAAWRGHTGSTKQLEVSHTLLRMLTSWEEYDGIRAHLSGETAVSEQHDVSQQDTEAAGLPGLSERTA